LAFLVAVLFVEWIPFGFLGLGLSKVHFVYFTIGYLVMKYKDALKKYFMLVQLFSLISFPILVSQWHRTKGFSFLRQVDNFFGSLSVVFVPQLIIYGCVILLALSGIVISYMIIQYVIKNTVFYKYFCKLGNYTLDIYVSHIYFLYGIGIGLTKVFSSVFVAIFASLAIAILILRRIQILNLFFLGGRIRIANKINSRIVAESVIA